MGKKRYKGFKNRKSYKKGKLRIKKQLRGFLKDKKLSRRELKKIRTNARKGGYQGSAKRLAKLIKRSSKSVKPKAFKKGRIQGVAAKKNTRRLKQIKKRAAATKTTTPFYGPLKDPTKPAPNTKLPAFPKPTGPNLISPPGKTKEKPKVVPKEETKTIVDPPDPPPPPPTEPPLLPTPDTKPSQPVVPEPPKLVAPPPAPEIDWASLLKASQDTNRMLTKQLSQPRQRQPAPAPAPTINVQMPEMPEPEEALGRAKATSTYLSGGSAGGMRRRRSNRSKLGLSGLGTNQLSRNVSNLLSIRGISI